MNLARYRPGMLALAACSLALAGCTLGPDYQRPQIESPSAWRGEGRTSESLVNLPWWTFYRDPVLTNLIGQALENNKDLRLATARIEQALGGYYAQRSYLLPTVDAAGGWTRARSGVTQRTSSQFNVFGLLSYEVDIWGRLRRLTESARAQLLATEEARKAVYINLIATTAQGYFDLQALDQQLAIARRTYASRTNSLELTRLKFNNRDGVVSELDVRQAETQVFSAQATIAQLERSVALAENYLSFVMGRNPGPIPRDEAPGLPERLGEIPAGLPSDLLLRRPDILEAEQALVAANADIGAARAAYFPTISLTAALGLESVELSDLFDAGASKAWKFAPQLAVPLFNAGRVQAGVRVAEARRQAALSTYEQVIQNSFREVEDALVSVARLREQVQAQAAAVEAERKRLDLSMDRYEAGLSTFLDVLDAERSLFSAELGLVQTRNDLRSAHSQLYKALGGGWTPGS